MNPINQIVIEGPDLSGKTTLYQNIHNMTDYRWNIQDRSALSMLVHAKLYDREQFTHIESLKTELRNLNNFMILLLPKWDIIAKRFEVRGDEIQNLISLRKIYNLFENAAKEFESFPNVYVIRNEIDDFILKNLILNMLNFESTPFHKLSKLFISRNLASKNFETVGLSLTSFDDSNFEDINFDYLEYDKEKAYYQNIKMSLLKKIDNELNGVNEYCRGEDQSSRRFIYASDTCISLAHFLFRDDMLDCKFFIRSSNTRDILKYDLNFIKYLSKCVKERLFLKENTVVKINVVVNSAHIPSSINEVSEKEIESKD